MSTTIKASDFLRQVLEPLNLNDNDVEAALQASGLKEVELPAMVKDKFNAGYLTPERAASDDRVLSKARGMAYAMVEQKFSKHILPKLKEDDQKLVNDATSIFDKILVIEKAIEKSLENPNASEDVKKLQEAWRKKESEYNTQIGALQKEKKETEENKAKEIESIKMDFALRSKISNVELAEEWATNAEYKDFLANSNIDFLKKNYVLQFDEQNPSTILLRKQSEGGLVDVYEYEGKPKDDKKAYTLEDVIDRRFDKFKKKSNADVDKDKPKPQKTNLLTLPSDKPLTLKQLQQQAAGITA
jgi:hypothetical protein